MRLWKLQWAFVELPTISAAPPWTSLHVRVWSYQCSTCVRSRQKPWKRTPGKKKPWIEEKEMRSDGSMGGHGHGKEQQPVEPNSCSLSLHLFYKLVYLETYILKIWVIYELIDPWVHPHPGHHWKPRFLNLSAIDISDQVIRCCGAVLCTIGHLVGSPASSHETPVANHPPPQAWPSKVSAGIAKCLQGTE